MDQEENNPDIKLTFSEALNRLKKGDKVCRARWNGKDMWIKMQFRDMKSKMTLSYIYMKTVQGDLVPWLCSQTDMLADDWEIVE